MPKDRAIPTIVAAPGCIVLRPYQEETAIELADNVKNRDNSGTAISVGPPYRNEHGVEMSTPVNEGDIVIHGNFNPLPMYTHYGKLYRVIRFQEVVAKIV